MMLTVVAVLLFDLALLVLLWRCDSLKRPVVVPDLKQLSLLPVPAITNPEYRQEIALAAGFAEGAADRAVAAMKWVMNQVGGNANCLNSDSPDRLISHVKQGGGCLCDGMSRMVQSALQELGITSRQLVLCRNLFDPYDRHYVVEVWINDQWQVLDPTFNVTYTDSRGYPLGGMEIKRRMYKGCRDDITVCYHGEVSYPCRYEDYYVDPLLLYNNVFVRQGGSGAIWARLPPAHYLLGPRFYCQTLVGESDLPLQLWRWLYTGAVVLLPCLALFLLLFELL